MAASRYELPVRVYSPESPIRSPRRLIAEALHEMRASRTLAWRLAVRDISAQYRQTVLGYVWAVLPVVMLTLVWVVLNRANIVRVSSAHVPYPVFALTGTVFWQLVIDALNAPLAQLSANRTMLVRVRFPAEVLIASGITQVAFSFLIKLGFLAIVIVAYAAPIHWTVALVFIPALALIVLGTVAGVLVAPLGLLYKDVQQGLLAVVAPLMFVTPVVYPPPSSGFLAAAMHYNPLTPLFLLIRGMVYGGAVAPYILGASVVVACALLLGLLTWLVFHLAMPLLIERLEA